MEVVWCKVGNMDRRRGKEVDGKWEGYRGKVVRLERSGE